MDSNQNLPMDCWVCYVTDPRAEWLHPCRCRGSTKWVHKACLQRWVDEKQQGDRRIRVSCPMCTVDYRMTTFYNLGPAVCLLGLARCAAVNYGALTAFMQAHPLVSLITIPVFILGRSLLRENFTHPVILNFPEDEEAIVPTQEAPNSHTCGF